MYGAYPLSNPTERASKNVVLVDINIDLLNDDNSNISAHFCALNMRPLIDQPTRVTQSSATIYTPVRIFGLGLTAKLLPKA
jgi:hypothetical protein